MLINVDGTTDELQESERAAGKRRREFYYRAYSRWINIVLDNSLTAYSSTIIFFKKAAKHKNVEVSNGEEEMDRVRVISSRCRKLPWGRRIGGGLSIVFVMYTGGFSAPTRAGFGEFTEHIVDRETILKL